MVKRLLLIGIRFTFLDYFKKSLIFKFSTFAILYKVLKVGLLSPLSILPIWFSDKPISMASFDCENFEFFSLAARMAAPSLVNAIFSSSVSTV